MGFNFNDLGGLIQSPVVQGILSWLGAGEQSRVQNQYEQRVDQQIQEALQLAQERAEGGLGTYDYLSQQALDEIRRGNTVARGGARAGIRNAEQNRLSFLDDLGGQNQAFMQGYRGDLDRVFAETETRQGGDIAANQRNLEGFLSGMSGDEAKILGGYRDRYKFAENELEGYGQQQENDINQLFDERSAARSQDLLSRGLGSSTVASTEQGVVDRERSAEQRRLGEDLTRNRVNILGGILGEQSAAQERLAGNRNQYGYAGVQANNAQRFAGAQNLAAQRFAGAGAINSQQAQLNAVSQAYDAAMRGDVLAARQALSGANEQGHNDLANFYGNQAANRSNLYMQGMGDWLNTLTGINYIPPPSNAQQQFQFGQNSVQAAQPQSSLWDSLWPALAGNIGGAGVGAALGGFTWPGGAGAGAGAVASGSGMPMDTLASWGSVG